MADARPFHWEYVPEPVTREVFRVEGGRPLSGSVAISGAKNAALKMLAAATLTGERCRITNMPAIEDVRVMAHTLTEIGVVVDHPEDNVYELPWLPGDRAFLADPAFQAAYAVAHVELGPERWLSCYGRRDADLARLFPRARVFRQ